MSEAAAPSDESVLHTDVVIIGAGPVGLFAAFEAGVIGLSCHIVDALEQVSSCIPTSPFSTFPQYRSVRPIS